MPASFDETNYDTATEVTVWKGNELIARREVDFFTTSPIDVTVQAD